MEDSALCKFFWILIVHKLAIPYPKDRSAQFLADQPVRLEENVTACVMNKVLISNFMPHGAVSSTLADHPMKT